jgi:hypothetical protein
MWICFQFIQYIEILYFVDNRSTHHCISTIELFSTLLVTQVSPDSCVNVELQPLRLQMVYLHGFGC